MSAEPAMNLAESSRLGAAAIATGELWSALTDALQSRFGSDVAILTLERWTCPYSASYALEELLVELTDGTSLHLVLKDLSRARMHEDARHVKPSVVYQPLREIRTYEHLLQLEDLSTATYYGAAVDSNLDRYWMFLEHVEGWTLYEVTKSVWPAAARWLACLHGRFAHDALVDHARAAHLLVYEEDFYRLWPRRAVEFQCWRRSENPQEARRRISHLLASYDQIIGALLALPRTVIHGEFSAANVLVVETGDGHRICPVDWEMAAIGPGLIDLAALLAGKWTDEERRTVALAYRDALPSTNDMTLASDEFFRALDVCRLHLAMQWLGWSPQWTPPRPQAHDWLAEALELSEKLGL